MGGLWWHCLEVVTITTGGSFEASSVLILKLVPESSEASKPSDKEDGLSILCTQLRSHCAALYWLPRPPLPDADRNSWEHHNQAINNSRTCFAEILAKIPGIKSFVCMLMPSGRLVVTVSPDSDAYPFSAGILRAHSRRDPDTDVYVAYEGLFGVLLPYSTAGVENSKITLYG
jgi:hypothetical protein